MRIKSVVLLSIMLASATAYGEVYKWTDEKGQVHYDNALSKSRKESAEKIKVKNVSVMQSEHPEGGMRYVPSPREQNNQGTATPDAAAADSGAPAGNKGSKCEEEWRKYRESQACFAPYVIGGGRGVRAEAYEHCTSVSQPALCN